ncbi:hypothetical protein M422DRAFT_26423 [Sphaerobolus stellatus SS14]|nr:hypothetical protein M422DRAFT_26423 [Sphaerobolus stellatus SS14]
MNGAAPMFGTSMLVLVIHTWSDLRAKLHGSSSPFTRLVWLRVLCIILPYLAFLGWSGAALGLTFLAPLRLIIEVSSCINAKHFSHEILRGVGLFMLVLTITELIIQGFIVHMINKYRSDAMTGKKLIDVSMFFRILILSLIELFTIILGTILSIFRVPINNAFIVIESMNALATFLALGTSNSILEAWGLKTSNPSISDASIELNNYIEGTVGV